MGCISNITMRMAALAHMVKCLALTLINLLCFTIVNLAWVCNKLTIYQI